VRVQTIIRRVMRVVCVNGWVRSKYGLPRIHYLFTARCYEEILGMGGPFVEDSAGGLGLYWFCKSLMYSRISVRVYCAAANSIVSLLMYLLITLLI
jgi:hypothetical protein